MEATALRIRKQHADKVPCVVRVDDEDYKFIVPRDLTLSELLVHLRKRMRKRHDNAAAGANKAMFLLTETGVSPTGVTTMGELDATLQSDYVRLNGRMENVFG